MPLWRLFPTNIQSFMSKWRGSKNKLFWKMHMNQYQLFADRFRVTLTFRVAVIICLSLSSQFWMTCVFTQWATQWHNHFFYLLFLPTVTGTEDDSDTEGNWFIAFFEMCVRVCSYRLAMLQSEIHKMKQCNGDTDIHETPMIVLFFMQHHKELSVFIFLLKYIQSYWMKGNMILCKKSCYSED